MARAHMWALVTVAALASSGFASSTYGADAALERIAAGLRANDLKSVRYSGEGLGWTFGQAYKPGEAWPKIRVNSWTRTVNYETGAMRDEIVLTRAEALGGAIHPREVEGGSEYAGFITYGHHRVTPFDPEAGGPHHHGHDHA